MRRGFKKKRPWLVLREGSRLRWGGDLRRHYVFSRLGDVAPATYVHGWTSDALSASLTQTPAPPGLLLASAEFLEAETLELARAHARLAAFDIVDDVVAQLDAYGLALDPSRRSAMRESQKRNLDAFEIHVAQSHTFVRQMGLDPSRTLIAPNGTDTTIVRPVPWPAEPRIAMASGAAPRRGIENLIEAARSLRGGYPDLRLDLWLVATGEESRAYLDRLRAAVAGDPWIAIGHSSYRRLGANLGKAIVVCVPNEPYEYWDGVIPVKLPDGLAAGRPVVVTPRVEMKAIVERGRAGVVAADDSVEALAEALERVISDEAYARRLGAAARRVAERELDWGVISARIARELVKWSW